MRKTDILIQEKLTGFQVCEYGYGGKNLGQFETRAECTRAITKHCMTTQTSPDVYFVNQIGEYEILEKH